MKKLLAMTLAALMAFSMAACSEKDDDDEDSEKVKKNSRRGLGKA